MESLNESLDFIESQSRQCDLTFLAKFRQALIEKGLSWKYEDIRNYLVLVRSKDLIDDLFFDLILRNARFDDEINLNLFANRKEPIRPDLVGKKTKDRVKKIYEKIGHYWPDGKAYCPLYTAFNLLYQVEKEFETKRNGTLYRKAEMSSALAYHLDYISLDNYLRMKGLVDADIMTKPFSLAHYLENIKYAKNKLTNSLSHIRVYDESVARDEVSKTSRKFSEKFIERRNKVTIRERLYRKYNSTQIMLLAEILVKASKRMNAYRSEIDIYYKDGNSPDETYVISPMEQYRMALKMLQKDMNNIELMQTFAGKNVTYDEVIMAALETGVITLAELDVVIGHEEFWNPKTPAWKSILGFVFDLAGTASFYLPPPWNVVGAIGLVFTETKIYQANKKADASQNTNSIF